MRWRIPVFMATIGLVVLASAEPALAKGPDQATISGPGLPSPVVVTGYGEPGSGDGLGELAEGSGLFLVMFGSDGSGEQSLAPEAPAGPLGPKYDLSYRVPSGAPTGDVVRQDLYPQAAGGPVTYTKAGQAVFGTETRGGWYRTPATFGRLLLTLGVPAAANATVAPTPRTTDNPARQPAAAPAQERPWLPIAVTSLLAVVTLVAVSVGLARRRAAAHGSASQASAPQL